MKIIVLISAFYVSVALLIMPTSARAGESMSNEHTTPVITAPTRSKNGSYVVSVDPKSMPVDRASECYIELYRNENGGAYSELVSGPAFRALSQIVDKNGIYGYKARWKVRSGKEWEVSDFGDAVFVTVESSIPRIARAARETKEIQLGSIN